MKRILVANSNEDEIRKICTAIDNEYIIKFIKSPGEVNGHLDKCDFMLLDQNFTQNSGLDFLTDIQGKSYFPVVIVTSPDDSVCALEAMRLGAHNYLVKTPGYYGLISHSIKEAIARFSQIADLKKMIIYLRKRVAELEEMVSKSKIEEGDNSSQTEKKNLLEEITSRFKRGEINLPSYPQINHKFKEMLRDGANVEMISNLLKKDAGISSKLISLSNSPFYRGISENKTVEQSVSRLGLIETKNIVSVISNRSLYMAERKTYKVLLKNLWEHSLACAYASEFISKKLQLKSQDEIFTMSLLHDVGKLLLMQVISELETKGIFDGEANRDELFSTVSDHHGRFGAALLRKWGFGDDYVRISLHHDRLDEAESISKPLLVIHLANLMVKDLGYGEKPTGSTDFQNIESMKLLRLSIPVITEIMDQVNHRMQNFSL